MRNERAFTDFPPPGCPLPRCPHYGRRLPPESFRLLGRYHTRGYPDGVPLYRCLRGGHAFSLRRFSPEFYLQKPHLTVWAIEQFASCVSLRQAARQERKLSVSSLERRMKRFGQHAQRLLRRVARKGPKLSGVFLLDEAESYERDPLMAPVTIPVLVHGASGYAIAAHIGTLAPRIHEDDERWRAKQLFDLVSGTRPRRDESRKVVGRCFERLVRIAERGRSVLLTDQKTSYRSVLRRFDPDRAVLHQNFPSPGSKHSRHVLFMVNLLLAMIRDALARMRRRTWCYTKSRLRLWWHLGIYFVWKNFVRVRFNGEKESAAQRAGIAARRWEVRDLVVGRLDLGAISFCALEGARA